MPAETGVRGLFITGTDTGVGKTLLGAALARFLQNRGIDVGVMKPVETGVEKSKELEPDAELLQWAANCKDEPELISPYRLLKPLAPSVAAEKENVTISFSHLIECCRILSAMHRFIILEGAGGLMVPIKGSLLMADLAKQVGFPLLVVCRPNLGTINHTLLTLFAARTLEIPVAGFFINNMPAEPGEAEISAPQTLASLAPANLWGVLKKVKGDEKAKVEAVAQQMAHLPALSPLLESLGL
jgi:dethiobiotin synthetase